MIYVFNGVKEICSLPGKACQLCGQCCQEIHCEPCKEACSSCGQCFVNFMDRPLSTYVIVKVVISSLLLYACIVSLSEPACEGCQSKPINSTWLYVMTGLGVLHLIFAPYFQIRVWHRLEEEIAKGPPAPRPLRVSASVVHEAFKQVFLHDLGILFYFFVLIFAFAWAWLGQVWIEEATKSGCEVPDSTTTACTLTYVLVSIAVIYTGLYYCCSCCAGSVELQSAPGIPDAPQVAAPGRSEMC